MMQHDDPARRPAPNVLHDTANSNFSLLINLSCWFTIINVLYTSLTNNSFWTSLRPRHPFDPCIGNNISPSPISRVLDHGYGESTRFMIRGILN
jgi:hypothetical protein